MHIGRVVSIASVVLAALLPPASVAASAPPPPVLTGKRAAPPSAEVHTQLTPGDQSQALSGPYTITIARGRTTRYSVVFSNQGTTTWTPSAGYVVRETQNGNSISLANGCDSVVSFSACGFDFHEASPPFTGSFSRTYRMYHGSTPFGDTISVFFNGTPLPAVAGHGFNLSRGSSSTSLLWTGGTQPTGFLVIRWTPTPTNTYAFLPSPTNFLSAGTTSFVDTNPIFQPTYCYILFAFGAPPSYGDVRGISDLLCAYPSSANNGGPAEFDIELQGNIAVLTWDAFSTTAGSFVMTSTTFNGAGPLVSTLNFGEERFTAQTGGNTTCFQLEAKNGNTSLGTTHKLCAAPGSSSFTAGRGVDLNAAVERMNVAVSQLPH